MKIRADIDQASLIGILLEGQGDVRAEIAQALQQAGVDFSVESIVEICREKFQEVAEEVDTGYGDRYDDGGSSFNLSDDYEDENIFFYIEGTGYATRRRGMRGDNYLVPDDPDEVEFSANKALVTVYRPGNDDDTPIGSWDIANLL